MRRGWTVLSAVMVVMLALAWTSPAAACSGGPTRFVLSTDLARDDIDLIVHGKVLEVDDSALNAVIKVRRGLNRVAPPAMLLAVQNTPEGIVYNRDYRSSYSCGPEPVPFTVGSDVVLLLRHGFDGTYIVITHQYFTFGAFPNRDSRITLNASLTPDGPVQNLSLGREELIDLFLSAEGMGLGDPYDVSQPRLNALLIATDQGSVYILPVDSARPQRIVNRSQWLSAFRYATCDGCWFTAAAQGNLVRVDDIPHINVMRSDIPAQYSLLSPGNEASARWLNENGITRIEVRPQYPFTPNPEALPNRWSIEVRIDDVAGRFNLGAWSPDGRVLAYVDDVGVWLWDVYTDSDATTRLEVEADEVLQFSRTGRFLRLERNGERFWLDLVTEQRLADGAFNPDDRRFLPYHRPMTVSYVLQGEDNVITNGRAVVHEAVWIDDRHVAALMCIEGERETCAVVDWTEPTPLERHSSAYRPVPYEGYAFDVSADTGSLAVVGHDQSLSVRDGPSGKHAWFNFRHHLDGDIVAVEWMPAVMYYAEYEGAMPVRR